MGELSRKQAASTARVVEQAIREMRSSVKGARGARDQPAPDLFRSSFGDAAKAASTSDVRVPRPKRAAGRLKSSLSTELDISPVSRATSGDLATVQSSPCNSEVTSAADSLSLSLAFS